MGFWAPHKKKQGFTGVITPTYRVITLPITFRGPSCKKFVWILRMRDFVNYWVVWVSDFVTIKKWKCSSAKRRRMYHCITAAAISLKIDGLQFADQFSFSSFQKSHFRQNSDFLALEKPKKKKIFFSVKDENPGGSFPQSLYREQLRNGNGEGHCARKEDPLKLVIFC